MASSYLSHTFPSKQKQQPLPTQRQRPQISFMALLVVVLVFSSAAENVPCAHAWGIASPLVRPGSSCSSGGSSQWSLSTKNPTVPSSSNSVLYSSSTTTTSETSIAEEDDDDDDDEYEYVEYDILTEKEFMGSEWLVGTVMDSKPNTIAETWVRLATDRNGKNVAIWGDGSQGKWTWDVANQFLSMSKENIFGKNIWAGVVDDYYFTLGTVRGWSVLTPAEVKGQWQAKRLGVDPQEAGTAPWFETVEEEEESEEVPKLEAKTDEAEEDEEAEELESMNSKTIESSAKE